MKKNLLFTVSLLLLFVISYGQAPLPVPDTLPGANINLNFQNGSRDFYTGITTNTIGINGDFLGPTIMLRNGDPVTMNVTNSISDTTTLHWHGLHVPAQADGGPHITIEPGTTWSPSFVVKDKAATYWYHPHLHMKTAEHVTRGAAGFIIVRDTEEDALLLPRTYGVDDFPLVVQTRAFDAQGQFIVESALDTAVLVNGAVRPFVDLPANVVRLRLLNGATERSFNFGFSNNQQFFMIGSDGGLLSAPVTMTRLLLSPGERAEVLVDLSGLLGQTIYLMSYASQIPAGIYGATSPQIMGTNIIPNYTQNFLNGTNYNVLQINVVASLPNGVTTIPATLANVQPIPASSAVKTRPFTFMPEVMGPTGSLIGPFVINMMPFDMMMINDTIILNDIEIWELTNQTRISHPFHIHDVHFYVLDINGVPPPAHQAGRKDVILVPPQNSIVRFIAQFDDYADPVFPYMYHCHMLTHEDGGMMGQFIVIDTITGMHEPEQLASSFSIYPNPATTLSNEVHITYTAASDGVVVLVDLSGKELQRTPVFKGNGMKKEISLRGVASGLYTVKLEVPTGNYYGKLVVIAE